MGFIKPSQYPGFAGVLFVLLLLFVALFFLSVVLLPNYVDPLQFKRQLMAPVIRVEKTDALAGSDVRRILVRIKQKGVKWGMSDRYQVGDCVRVALYQRAITQRQEYRLLGGSATAPEFCGS